MGADVFQCLNREKAGSPPKPTTMATGLQSKNVVAPVQLETLERIETSSKRNHAASQPGDPVEEERAMIYAVLNWGESPSNHHLFDCLMNIWESYRYTVETLHAAIKICRRFRSVGGLVGSDCQNFERIHKLLNDHPLLVASCFLIASKLHEVKVPLLRDLVDLSENKCTMQHIRCAEYLILETIDWNIYNSDGLNDPVHKV